MAILIFCNSLLAQDNNAFFEEGETYINEANGANFFKPLANAFSNFIHTGLFPIADTSDKFYFYIGVNSSITFIPDKDLTFRGVTEAPFEPEMSVDAPTIFGDNSAVVVQNDNNEAFIFPGGLQMKKFLLALPQVTVGGIANTDLTIRFLLVPLDDDFGDLKLFGLAARHNLSPYFGWESFDLSIDGAYHSFNMGTWLDSDFLMIRSTIRKNYGPSHVYGFLGYQNGKLTLENSREEISVTSKADNGLLFGVGGSVNWSVLNFNIELVANSYFTVNAGLGLKF
jgi:hypothetical protein